jgi:hypothetical protein
MNAYVFTSLAQAQAAVNDADSTIGFPAPGNPYGPGAHANASDAITKTYGGIWQNPGGTQWAYPADSVSGQLLPLKIPVPGVTNGLDISTWTQVWP